MITLHSVDLMRIDEKCFGESFKGLCRILTVKSDVCRTYKCPFYKPEGCEKWVRVEDSQGVNLVPPEEYENYYRRKFNEYRTGIRK